MTVYGLPEGIKVRDEQFGLLFYLCRSTDLVFINSGCLLKAADLRLGADWARLSAGLTEKRAASLQKLLDKLVQRGLLYAEG